MRVEPAFEPHRGVDGVLGRLAPGAKQFVPGGAGGVLQFAPLRAPEHSLGPIKRGRQDRARAVGVDQRSQLG